VPESAIGCIQYDKKQSDLYRKQQKIPKCIARHKTSAKSIKFNKNIKLSIASNKSIAWGIAPSAEVRQHFWQEAGLRLASAWR
jgi:hypothetical protein